MGGKGPIDRTKINLGSPQLNHVKVTLSFGGSFLLEGLKALRTQYSTPETINRIPIGEVCDKLFAGLSDDTKETIKSNLMIKLGADHMPEAYLFDLTKKIKRSAQYEAEEIAAKLIEINEYSKRTAVPVALPVDFATKMAIPDNPLEMEINEETVNAFRVAKLLYDDPDKMNETIFLFSEDEKRLLADTLQLEPDKLERVLNHLLSINKYFPDIYDIIKSLENRIGSNFEDAVRCVSKLRESGIDIKFVDFMRILSLGITQGMAYQISSARDEILSGLGPHDIFRLGQIYEMMRNNKYFTASEWNSFLSFYVNNQRFRESFVVNYIKPTDQPHLINLHDAQTAEIFDQQSLLQRGKLYFDTFAILEEYKSISIPEETQSTVIASLFTVYPGEKYSAEIETAIVDHGKNMVPLLLKGAKNIGEERTERIIQKIAANEDDYEYVMQYLIDIIGKGRPMDTDYQIAVNILRREPTGLFNLLSEKKLNGYLVSLIIKILNESAPDKSIVAQILSAFSFIGQKVVDNAIALSNDKLRKAIIGYLNHAADLKIKNAELLIADYKYRLERIKETIPKLESKLGVHNLFEFILLIESFSVYHIRHTIRSFSEGKEALLLEARRTALEVLDFAREQESGSPDIAYLPGFIAARIPGEYREKAVDEIKRAIKADPERNGIYAALDIVQNILGPEIYIALGKAYKDLEMSELYPEALIYANIIKETNRRKKVPTILKTLQEYKNKELWISLFTLIGHDKFEETRHVISIILEKAREKNRANPFYKENIEEAIDSARKAIEDIIKAAFTS